MDNRFVLRSIAAGRVVVGTSLVVLPGTVGATWVGDSAHEPATKVFARALGVRDLALGLGALQALETGQPVRQWAVMGMVSDAVDLTASLLAIRRIGLRRALTVAVIAGSAIALAANALEDEE
ncbi:MAG: hypothetical protein MUF83_20905 [Acidimicrobiales bacterium]|jgi:hypothetical protein|nr:hypothetical protein [Acidimicrobiales bacterium]